MVRTLPGFQTKPELHLAAELSLEMMVNSFGQVALRPISLPQCLQFDLSSEVERNRDNLAFQLQRIVSELAAEIRGRVTPGCANPMSFVAGMFEPFVPGRDPACGESW
jgi:hypothetical protein